MADILARKDKSSLRRATISTAPSRECRIVARSLSAGYNATVPARTTLLPRCLIWNLLESLSCRWPSLSTERYMSRPRACTAIIYLARAKFLRECRVYRMSPARRFNYSRGAGRLSCLARYVHYTHIIHTYRMVERIHTIRGIVVSHAYNCAVSHCWKRCWAFEQQNYMHCRSLLYPYSRKISCFSLFLFYLIFFFFFIQFFLFSFWIGTIETGKSKNIDKKRKRKRSKI